MYIGRLRYTKINIYQYIVSNIHSCLTSKPSDLECEGEPETVLVRQVHHGDVHQVLQCRHVRRLEQRQIDRARNGKKQRERERKREREKETRGLREMDSSL